MHDGLDLIAFQRRLPAESEEMRQTFTAAAAAPHGGHVIIEEQLIYIHNGNRITLYHMILVDASVRMIDILLNS